MTTQETVTFCVNKTGEARNPLGSLAPLDMYIAIGFGSAEVTRNGATVLDGEAAYQRGENPPTVADAEALAAKDTEADWRIDIYGPLWEATWQRQKPERWVCIRAGQGFA